MVGKNVVVIDRFDGEPLWSDPGGNIEVSNVEDPAKEGNSMRILCPASWHEYEGVTNSIETYIVDTDNPLGNEHYYGAGVRYLKFYNYPSTRIMRSFSTPWDLSYWDNPYINVTKAELKIKKDVVHSSSGINNIRLITESWDYYNGPTWDDQPSMGDIISTFDMQAPVNEIITIDITETVEGWIDGSISNYGLAWDAESILPYLPDDEIPKAHLYPHVGGALDIEYERYHTPDESYIIREGNLDVDLNQGCSELLIWARANRTGSQLGILIVDSLASPTVAIMEPITINVADSWELKRFSLTNIFTGKPCTYTEKELLGSGEFYISYSEDYYDDYIAYVDYCNVPRTSSGKVYII